MAKSVYRTLMTAEFGDWLKDNHTGRAKAITAKMMFQWGKPREIRIMVNDLREQGHPICSGSEGYYYASVSTELKKTEHTLFTMANTIGKTLSSVRGARKKMALKEQLAAQGLEQLELEL